MAKQFDKVKRFLDILDTEKIYFKQHFYESIEARPISQKMVIDYLKDTDKLLRVEQQPSDRSGENKYKLWFKMSNRYNLVVIGAVSKKDLYIITAWNSDRKWQKTVQK